MTHHQAVVIKLGGSLFDLPELGLRLRRWLDGLPTSRAVLLSGGGAAADMIRDADARHRIGEEPAHWLALRALSLNSHLLAALLPRSAVVGRLNKCPAAWKAGLTPILDPLAWMEEDEARAGRLPHRWAVTSDSVAARVACIAGAAELILLKSAAPPQGLDWEALARAGFVDAWFPRLAPLVPSIRLINFCELSFTSSASS